MIRTKLKKNKRKGKERKEKNTTEQHLQWKYSS